MPNTTSPMSAPAVLARLPSAPAPGSSSAAWSPTAPPEKRMIWSDMETPITGSAASTTRHTSGSPKMNMSARPHVSTQMKRPADASFSPFIDWMSVTLSPRNWVSSPAELISSSKKPTSIVSHFFTEPARRLRVRCSPAMPKPEPSNRAAATSSTNEQTSRMPQGQMPCAATWTGLTVNGMISIREKSTPMHGHTAAAMNMPTKPAANHQPSPLSW
mmetsp:Transcript_17246/g.56362  ORF Transcript_17246/g.56362 Transcript_17246/m.56362 type:complete len:216 (+) Transcript_17246:242-889(+)